MTTLQDYMEISSAYPAHNDLTLLILSSTWPVVSTQGAQLLASTDGTGTVLDAQNFGLNCTTAIRAPEWRFEDMIAF